MHDPQSPPPAAVAQLLLEATTHYQQGRFAGAEAACARIREIAPDNPDAPHLLGLIQLKQGNADAALSLIEASLAVDPRSAKALASQGRVLAALNRPSEALASFEQSLTLDPGDPDTQSNCGSMLLSLGRPADALVVLDRAAALAPGHFGALVNRGNALALLGRFEEALAQYQALLATHPARPELHFNRGNALAGLARHAEAIAAFDQVVAIDPNYIGACINRGVSLQALNRHQDALASFASAIRIERTNIDARANAALSLLALGNYHPGFIQYEMRRNNMPPHNRDLGKPVWRGETSPSGKTLLLHAEQGFGDTIQFVRYVPLVAELGAKIILEVPAELMRLLQRVDGVAALVEQGRALPNFDLHCPLPSLPLAMGTELATIPARIPYLKPSEEGIARWRPRLEPIPHPRVAIAWSGRKSHPNNPNRSIALAQLAPLLDQHDLSFISIQHELSEEDRAVLSGFARVTHLGDELQDFDDTAAILALVDLVISVDTSVANLAGALGVPAWILLAFAPDWRWMPEGIRTPWYPAARLYRQRTIGDWSSVVSAASADLQRLRNAAPAP